MLYILTMMSWSICTEQYAWEQGVARMGDMHTATLPGQHSLLEELSSRKSHSPQAAVVFRGSCGGGFFFFSWATGWKWLLWLVCFSEQGRSLSHWGCYWGGWLLEDISCTCFLSKAVFPSQTVFVYWRSYTTHLHLWLVLAAHFSYCVSKLHQHFHCKHACKDLVAHCCLCRRTAIPAEGATAVVGPGFCPKTQGLAWLVLLKELFAGNKRALAQHSMLTYVLTEVNAEQVWLTRQLSEHGPLSEGTPTVAGCRGSGS